MQERVALVFSPNLLHYLWTLLRRTTRIKPGGKTRKRTDAVQLASFPKRFTMLLRHQINSDLSKTSTTRGNECMSKYTQYEIHVIHFYPAICSHSVVNNFLHLWVSTSWSWRFQPKDDVSMTYSVLCYQMKYVRVKRGNSFHILSTMY